MSSSTDEHRRLASQKGPVALAIVTVSDTRTLETDTNGQFLKSEIERLDHRLVDYRIVKDEADDIGALLKELAAGEAQLLLFNGGTGISPRDTTFDVLSAALDKTLPGFGELFRMLSWDQVGAAAMLSRATAGVYNGKVVISTPGSNAAVKLAWEKLILPELEHLAWEVARTANTSQKGPGGLIGFGS
jgi:molybdenum cofactor biosynthesis protein B